MTQHPKLPNGWNHLQLELHRSWYARQNLSWRCRQMLALLTLGGALGLLFGNPWPLVLGLIGLLWNPAWPPVRLMHQQTLREIERQHGAAYTTALVVADERHGFAERLRKQAEQVARNASLPALPWLELLAAGLIVSLLLFVPAPTPFAPKQANNQPSDNPSTQPNNSSESPKPETDAGFGAAPNAPNAASGPNSEGAAAGEQRLGRVQRGQSQGAVNDSNSEPEATNGDEDLNRAFERALEQGTVRGIPKTPTKPTEPKPNSDAQASTDGNRGDPNGNAEGDGGKTRDRNGKPNNPSQAPKSTQGQPSNPNDPASQSDPSTANRNGTTPKQDKPSGQQSGQSNRRDLERRNQERAASGEDFGLGQGQSGPAGQGQRGKGSNQSGAGQDVARSAASNGKLEFLPGAPSGNQASSSALPLPGDPSRALTATPGSAQYRRAAEGAVLDPRLPAEYQELLRRYYR